MTERIVLSGQNCSAIFINETGLYNLVLSSRQPIAKRFKRLVSVKGCPFWTPPSFKLKEDFVVFRLHVIFLR
ncbi:BRO family protein [uncultured Ruminococcus sp.]|uniref:BRO family protein n=1 Tax=uncultured Ruminococcus sp. TaxID=165186 RepID=UPI00344B161E